MLSITSTQAGDVVRVAPVGRLDSTTSTELENELNAQFADGMNLLALDCSGIEYVSSAGLRVLLMAAKRLRKSQGKVALAQVHPSVLKVLELSGFTKMFEVADSMDDATRYLTS